MAHIVTTLGSCLNIVFNFQDADGNPNDISDDSFGVVDCSPTVFREAVFTKTDPMNGRVDMFLSAEHARGLLVGCGNWFRLRRTVQGGCDDNTPEIEVEVI